MMVGGFETLAQGYLHTARLKISCKNIFLISFFGGNLMVKKMIFRYLFSGDEYEPTFWQAKLSFLIRQAKSSFFQKSQAELFAFKTEPNRAFGLPKSSNFLTIFS